MQGPKTVGTLFSQSSLQSNFVSDAIIGSLPKGLSGKERERIFQSVPLSPTLNLLHSMPSVGCAAPTPHCSHCTPKQLASLSATEANHSAGEGEQQNLRRKEVTAARAARGRHRVRHRRLLGEKVHIRAGELPSCLLRMPALMRPLTRMGLRGQARELGVRSVIIDGPDSWSQSLVKDGIVERFIGLDFSDADTVFERCLEAIKKAQSVRSPAHPPPLRLKSSLRWLSKEQRSPPGVWPPWPPWPPRPRLGVQEFGELDGVCTFCEMAVPLVARLAEKLGLPGNRPAAVDAARDKHATRAKLKEAGLPTPKNYLISEPHHVKEAARAVGFPSGESAPLSSLSPGLRERF